MNNQQIKINPMNDLSSTMQKMDIWRKIYFEDIKIFISKISLIREEYINYNIYCYIYPFILLGHLLILAYKFNLKKNFFDIKHLIKKSIIFRIIIGILSLILGFLNINNYISYILLGFIAISLGLTKEKFIFILKILFLLFFWIEISLISHFFINSINLDSIILQNIMTLFLLNLLADSLDINGDTEEFFIFKTEICKNLIQKFLTYYIIDSFDLYSDLNPGNSKDIISAIHQILKDLNLKQFYSNGGGPGWDPDFKPFLTKGLFLDSDESPQGIDEITPQYEEYTKNWEVNSKKIDEHNKNLFYLKDNEMIKEKNILLKHHDKLDYNFQTPHGISFFNGTGIIKDGFFDFFGSMIKFDIDYYNTLIGAKIYYEQSNKENLPYIFESIWTKWQMTQASSLPENIEGTNLPWPNYYKYSAAYGELYDNILIAGLSIACKVYIIEGLKNQFSVELDQFYNCKLKIGFAEYVNLGEFHLKAAELYKEAQLKYYVFFDHYAWHTKLFSINNLTKESLEKEIIRLNKFYESIEKLPSIDKDYAKYPRLDWYNSDLIPHFPKFKHNSTILGLALVHIEWTNMKDFLDLSPKKPNKFGDWSTIKDFYLKIINGKKYSEVIEAENAKIKNTYEKLRNLDSSWNMKDILKDNTKPKNSLPLKCWNPYKPNWHGLHQIDYSLRPDIFKKNFDIRIFKMLYDKNHASPNSPLDSLD